MSFYDYVSKLEVAQLENLIKIAGDRLVKLKSEGEVKIFGVFSSSANVGWFGFKHDADKKYLEEAERSLQGRYPEVSMDIRLVPIEELKDYLGEENTKELMDSNPKVIKPAP